MVQPHPLLAGFADSASAFSANRGNNDSNGTSSMISRDILLHKDKAGPSVACFALLSQVLGACYQRYDIAAGRSMLSAPMG